MINYSIWRFWSFFHFLYFNVSDNKCYKQKWRVLFFTRIKLVASVLSCARLMGHGISDFKLECGKMLIMKFCYHGSNFRWKFQAVLECAFRESDKNTPLSPLFSLKTMDWRTLGIIWASEIYFLVSIVLQFHIWFVMKIYHKMRQMLLQNVTAILLQNATEVYYKMRQDF